MMILSFREKNQNTTEAAGLLKKPIPVCGNLLYAVSPKSDPLISAGCSNQPSSSIAWLLLTFCPKATLVVMGHDQQDVL